MSSSLSTPKSISGEGLRSFLLDRFGKTGTLAPPAPTADEPNVLPLALQVVLLEAEGPDDDV